ncbi:MAG: DUF3276 family protein [Vicingaceae bacterium]
MEGSEKGGSKRRDDIYSQSLRAGNRTYFFDVKSTKSNELYLTITESKRRFNNDNGKFYYEKHKLFLYPEDFESFAENLNGTLEKIREMSEKEIVPREEKEAQHQDNETSHQSEENHTEDLKNETPTTKEFSDISFEDLGNDEAKS